MGLVVAGLFISLSANAALLSRLGGQAVYDTVLDITWLTDVNTGGLMTWASAKCVGCQLDSGWFERLAPAEHGCQ